MKHNDAPVTSHINLNEEVENLERYRTANPSYFPCYVCNTDGTVVPALFTQHEIDLAISRANKNLEDLGPKGAEEEVSWIAHIFGF